MRFLLHSRLRKLSFMSMGSLRTSATKPFSIVPLNAQSPCFSSRPERLITSFALRRININDSYKNHPLTPRTKELSSVSYRNSPELEDKVLTARSWEILNIKLKELGFDIGHFAPGVENIMLCPKCKGGDSEELSLSVFLDEDGFSAVWMCFRAK